VRRLGRVSAVTREVGWPMGHRLFRHDGPCAMAHGHNYAARVTVECLAVDTARAGTPKEGMVVDFKDLDLAIHSVVDRWDHAFMLQVGDPLMDQLEGYADLIRVLAPPTAENIAWMILDGVSRYLAGQTRLTVRRVDVFEGPKSVATAEEVE
jgi:6-pyruvoyltetrahydropterin/6-carboxytetrahydropterin synthase